MIDDEIQADLEEIKSDLQNSTSTKRKVTKVAKKVAKTEVNADPAPKKRTSKGKSTAETAPKRTRSERVEEGMISLRQLAEEAGLAPPVARAKLRTSDIDRGDGRWKFEEGSKRLKQARQILGIA